MRYIGLLFIIIGLAGCGGDEDLEAEVTSALLCAQQQDAPEECQTADVIERDDQLLD